VLAELARPRDVRGREHGTRRTRNGAERGRGFHIGGGRFVVVGGVRVAASSSEPQPCAPAPPFTMCFRSGLSSGCVSYRPFYSARGNTALYSTRFALPTPTYPTMIRGSPVTKRAILSSERYGYKILSYVDERALQKVVLSKGKTTI
jgi:hypothetical protein